MARKRTWAGIVLSTCVTALGPGRADAQKPAPVENISSFPHRSPADERKALHVPPGFEIQLVAAEPDIHKPLNLAFDDRGRLWVTDTVEYPFPAAPGTKPRDTVKILSDFGPGGNARKIETFADGLNIPIGLLPMPSSNAALVHSIPNIYHLEDSDGDGKADRRDVFYGVFGNRDTHGMTNAFTWGFDGWIYACHGFSNTSKVAGKDQRAIEMNSGNTYRMRADGSHAEYITHGQVNPFGLAFDTLGNLYSCDCHSRPIYQLLKGAWYPSFGKPDDGLGFGPEMVTHDHGSTGIAGISYYTATQFPEAYRGTIFIGNVVTNRINHDRVEFHGSSPRGIEQPDFVWSEDNWFRPVDIELGPDGALYIADFYNRIIGHYEVPITHPGRDRTSGRIWRIVYRGKEPAPAYRPADLTTASMDDLIQRLDDSNLAIRISAANQLVGRFSSECKAALAPILAAAPSYTKRVHALWVLERTGALEEPMLSGALSASDRALVVHALGVLANRQAISPGLRARALELLGSPDPFVARGSAGALGAHPANAQIRPLLALVEKTPADDQALIHVARMALRDQLATSDAWASLAPESLSERDRRELASIAPGVHNAPSAAFLLEHLRRIDEPTPNRNKYAHYIARYGDDRLQHDLARVASKGKSAGEELAILRAIQHGAQERGRGLDPASRTRAAELASSLVASKSPSDIMLGIDVIRDFGFHEQQPRLRAVVDNPRVPTGTRTHALGALLASDPRGNLTTTAGVLRDSAQPMPLRQSAAGLLGNLHDPRAVELLLGTLPIAPEALQTSIAEALARRRENAAALLDAVAQGKASARLLQNRGVRALLEDANLPKIGDRLAALTRNLPPADQNLSTLFAKRKRAFEKAKPDIALGAKVFEKNCATCHQIDGKGARIGPQLDGIGARGLERLLEDVLDPSRNVDQNFRVTTLLLDDGRSISGLVLREDGAVVVLADATGKEIRVPRMSVEEHNTSPLSLMPSNMSEQIGEAEFSALMAYLLAKTSR